MSYYLISMPPSKVCPQCETIVPLRLKVCRSCQHVFRAKRKVEHNLPDKGMTRMRVLQSDSVNSAMKAKDKLQKASKRTSETSDQTVHRREKDRNHKASMRASETSERTVHRQETDRNHKASKRVGETSEQTVHRQQQNRKHMSSMRASESSDHTVHRREKDRSNKASMRATETSEQTVHIQQQNREHMRATKKASNVLVQLTFHSDIKNGPDFVRLCCHRLMYNKSVVPCNLAKYTKCSNNLLECVFSAGVRVNDTGNEWVCKTCDRALKRGVMPLQAKANALPLSQILPELSEANLSTCAFHENGDIAIS